jgi:hypothetical protein
MYAMMIIIRHRQRDSYSSIYYIIIFNAKMWPLISVLLPQVGLPLPPWHCLQHCPPRLSRMHPPHCPPRLPTAYLLMAHLEPNAMVLKLVRVLTHPKLGAVAAMMLMRVHFQSKLIILKFLWERIAVMGLWPAVAIFKECKVETML